MEGIEGGGCWEKLPLAGIRLDSFSRASPGIDMAFDMFACEGTFVVSSCIVLTIMYTNLCCTSTNIHNSSHAMHPFPSSLNQSQTPAY